MLEPAVLEDAPQLALEVAVEVDPLYKLPKMTHPVSDPCGTQRALSGHSQSLMVTYIYLWSLTAFSGDSAGTQRARLRPHPRGAWRRKQS